MRSEIEELSALVRRASAVAWDEVPVGELGEHVLELQRLQAELDALTGSVVGTFDRSGVWAEDRCRSATGWITHFGRVPRAAAGRVVKRARWRQLRVTWAALARGDITLDHVAVLARARTPERADVFDRHESVLVDQALTLQFADFERAVTYWCQRVDAEGAERERQERHRARTAYCSTTSDGVGVLDATLTPIGASIVGTELGRLEQQEFEADWVEARSRLGKAATAADLQRTPAQRRHDALVRMAERSASLEEGAPLARPLTNLHCDLRTYLAEFARLVADGSVPEGSLPEVAGMTAEEVAAEMAHVVGAGGRTGLQLCELADGTPILPSELVPLSLLGPIRRVVFGEEGRVLDLGRRSRLFVGGAREAVLIRDRVCQELGGCTVPAWRCQIDHLVAWDDGGETNVDNGQLTCGGENREREKRRRRRRRREGSAPPEGGGTADAA